MLRSLLTTFTALALTPAATEAIDQAVARPEIRDDIRQQARPGRPDLGAWETGGGR